MAGISRAEMWPRALLQVVPTGAGNEEFRPIPEKPFENCSQAIHMLDDNVLYIEFVGARPLIKRFSDSTSTRYNTRALAAKASRPKSKVWM